MRHPKSPRIPGLRPRLPNPIEKDRGRDEKTGLWLNLFAGLDYGRGLCRLSPVFVPRPDGGGRSPCRPCRHRGTKTPCGKNQDPFQPTGSTCPRLTVPGGSRATASSLKRAKITAGRGRSARPASKGSRFRLCFSRTFTCPRRRTTTGSCGWFRGIERNAGLFPPFWLQIRHACSGKRKTALHSGENRAHHPPMP